MFIEGKLLINEVNLKPYNLLLYILKIEWWEEKGYN